MASVSKISLHHCTVGLKLPRNRAVALCQHSLETIFPSLPAVSRSPSSSGWQESRPAGGTADEQPQASLLSRNEHVQKRAIITICTSVNHFMWFLNSTKRQVLHKPIKMILKLKVKSLSSGEKTCSSRLHLCWNNPHFLPLQWSFLFSYCFHFVILLLNSLKWCGTSFFINSATKIVQDTNTSQTRWRRDVTGEDFFFPLW